MKKNNFKILCLTLLTSVLIFACNEDGGDGYDAEDNEEGMDLSKYEKLSDGSDTEGADDGNGTPDGTAGSCVYRLSVPDASDLVTCIHYRGTSYTEDGVKDLCSQGTYREGSCSQTDYIGMCEGSIQTADEETDTYYYFDNSDALVKCSDDGGTWVKNVNLPTDTDSTIISDSDTTVDSDSGAVVDSDTTITLKPAVSYCNMSGLGSTCMEYDYNNTECGVAGQCPRENCVGVCILFYGTSNEAVYVRLSPAYTAQSAFDSCDSGMAAGIWIPDGCEIQ